VINTSPHQKRRRSMPVWMIRRCYFGPKHAQDWRVVGFVHARNEDSAIRKAAFVIKQIALLQAIRTTSEMRLEFLKETLSLEDITNFINHLQHHAQNSD
jgi:hypothetical protein